jgi:hypothetical protein
MVWDESHRYTVGRVIPWRVARLQSPPPFHPAWRPYHGEEAQEGYLLKERVGRHPIGVKRGWLLRSGRPRKREKQLRTVRS